MAYIIDYVKQRCLLSDPPYASLENAVSLSRSAQKKKKKKKARVTVLMCASTLLGIVLVVSLTFTYPSALEGIRAFAVGAIQLPAYFDTGKPEIKILSPSNYVTIAGPPTGVGITIVGEARDDGTGIQKVEVRFMTATSKTPYQMATPSSSQNWSTWTIERTLFVPGIYDISAKAIDNAGNEQWTTIQLNVSIGTLESGD